MHNMSQQIFSASAEPHQDLAELTDTLANQSYTVLLGGTSAGAVGSPTSGTPPASLPTKVLPVTTASVGIVNGSSPTHPAAAAGGMAQAKGMAKGKVKPYVNHGEARGRKPLVYPTQMPAVAENLRAVEPTSSLCWAEEIQTGCKRFESLNKQVQ